MAARSPAIEGHDVFVYFGNDQKSAAPVDASLLRSILRNSHHLELD
jgi:hypothetical protein